jgi:hypothetical protein
MRISTVVCLLSVAALAACGGGQKTTYTTANGTATVTKNGSTTTYESKEGKLTVGAVDPSKLGAPLYPGAAQTQENSSISVTSSKGSGTMASFTTTDKFPSVETWYNAHLPKGSEKMNVNEGGGSIAEFVMAENTPNQTLVMITGKNGATQIVITHGK